MMFDKIIQELKNTQIEIQGKKMSVFQAKTSKFDPEVERLD
jgi:hypothetical protein